MKRKLTLLCCCLLMAGLALTTAACTASSTATSKSSAGYEKTIAATRTEIWKAISGGGAASASVAISDNGKIVYEEGFGMANRTKALPVNSSTQFNIGSVSKMFVTMAVLKLCQDGKLELDQPVATYLPEFTMTDPRYQQITVRMLLNHTSELDGTYSYDTITTAPDADYMGYFLKNLSDSSLKGDPGIISIYCNDAFTLAQVLVEKVSGLSYADYLSKNILTKAGMNNTSCYFKADNPNLALSYKSDGSAADLEYVNSLGAGGIASNAHDLVKFGDAILAGKIIDAQLLDESFTPQYGSQTVPSGTPKMAFGLGWDSVNDEAYEQMGVRLIYKSGDTSEYHSMLYLLPDQNITIAVTFSGPVNTTEVTDVIAKTLLAEKGVISTETAAPVTTAKPAPVPDNLMAYAGYYTLSGNILKIDFNQAAGEMNLYSNSDTGFTLVDKVEYKDDGYFYGTDKRLTLEENFGTKFLMSHTLTDVNGSINATMLPARTSTISPAQFVGKQWITVNTLPEDTIFLAGSTWVMNEFPGSVLFGGGGYYLLNQLIDERTTLPNLKYTRDTMGFKLIDEQGQTMLQVGSFKLINTADVPLLQSGEKITIGTQNVARKLPGDGLIKPVDGRLVVLSPTLTPLYDSRLLCGLYWQ
ncbi:MAG: beta-lactamase family protein [Acetobacterium woodii]|nr:beta-lactamase family protein [Acetobacterium woodii]